MVEYFGEISPYMILALVPGLVQFIKELVDLGKWTKLVSLVMGITLGVLYQVAQMYPEVNVWFQVALYGLMVGAAASGYYDLTVDVGKKITNSK
jgi:hypothetical protein